MSKLVQPVCQLQKLLLNTVVSGCLAIWPQERSCGVGGGRKVSKPVTGVQPEVSIGMFL